MRLKSYRSPKAEVREKSKIQGKGLFAKVPIKKGELVFIKGGHIVDYEESKKIEAKFGEYCLQITDTFFICPKTKDEVKDTAIFINHSCNPNVGPDGQVSFVALRKIKAGEELCYDYAMTTSRKYRLVCNCGSRDCRKTITGDDWKLRSLQTKYGKHFTHLILGKIKKK
ncbi:MAG TPA: SET domain-containing protein-lysine N-methyltransferase [archaeon]|nr:SET domain-containing protein-lysine N-methyltransferase [archaeon]